MGVWCYIRVFHKVLHRCYIWVFGVIYKGAS